MIRALINPAESVGARAQIAERPLAHAPNPTPAALKPYFGLASGSVFDPRAAFCAGRRKARYLQIQGNTPEVCKARSRVVLTGVSEPSGTSDASEPDD